MIEGKSKLTSSSNKDSDTKAIKTRKKTLKHKSDELDVKDEKSNNEETKVEVKEEPESDDDLPLAARTDIFHKLNNSMPVTTIKEESDNGNIPFQAEEPLKRLKNKRKIAVNCDYLREEIKKFGHEMEVKLEQMIDESQKCVDSKFPKTREKVECPLCGERYYEILGHLEKHAKRTPHTCDICKKSFTFKGKLMDHKKFSHGISYSCEVCHKRFNHRDNIRIHMATHETEEKYVCYVCGYSTKRKQCLEVHMMRHEDKWVCHCTICNRGFFSYATLAQHMNSHTGEKPFTCDQCGANYSNYNTLWKHSRRFHPELYNNLFSCKICGKVFMKEKSYHIHMANLHSKGNHFECDSCTKTFKKELSLIIHKRTHTNERPYACKICGGAFTARKYLTKHMGVHKVKNYKCRFCYKKFMLEQALMTHERRHGELK